MVNSWLYTGGSEYYRYFTPEINGVSGPATKIKENTEYWESGTTRTFLYNLRIPVDPDNNVVPARFKVTDANGNMKDVVTFDTGAGNTVSLKAVQKATGLSLSPSSISLYTGETETLVPSVSPSDTYDKSVSFSSSDSAVATVSTAGVVSAKKAGSAKITVTTNDKSNISKSVNVTVKQYVTSITVIDSSLALYTDYSYQISASCAPTDATDKSLSFYSSNNAVAKVNASGKVVALKAGTATITVTATDRSTVEKTLIVNVLQKAQSITINNSVSELYVGSSHQLSCSVLPIDTTDKSITFTSSNTSVLSVNTSGLITALKTGTATLTVKTTDGSSITKTMNLVVKQYVSTVSLNAASVSLNTGSTFQIVPSVSPADATNKTLSYSSNNSSSASVDSSRLITALKAGTAKITVTANDRGSIKATVDVMVLQKATSLTINTPTAVLYTNETSQLSCSVYPSDTTDKSLAFSSSDINIASISSAGQITAKKAGTVNITVKTKDGSNITKSFTLTVKQYVTSLSAEPKELIMFTGEKADLNITVMPEDANDKTMQYVSSNEDIITMSGSGKITAKKAGKAKITVTANDRGSIKATIDVTVLQKATSLTINAPPAVLYTNEISQLSCSVYPSDTTDKSLAFSSSDINIAIISSAGQITAKKAGTVDITVKTKDGSDIKKSFTLTVKQYVTSLSAKPKELIMFTGEKADLNIIVLPEDATDKSQRYISSDEAIITVSKAEKSWRRRQGQQL